MLLFYETDRNIDTVGLLHWFIS